VLADAAAVWAPDALAAAEERAQPVLCVAAEDWMAEQARCVAALSLDSVEDDWLAEPRAGVRSVATAEAGCFQAVVEAARAGCFEVEAGSEVLAGLAADDRIQAGCWAEADLLLDDCSVERKAVCRLARVVQPDGYSALEEQFEGAPGEPDSAARRPPVDLPDDWRAGLLVNSAGRQDDSEAKRRVEQQPESQVFLEAPV
jgi:hypothetical protein